MGCPPGVHRLCWCQYQRSYLELPQTAQIAKALDGDLEVIAVGPHGTTESLMYRSIQTIGPRNQQPFWRLARADIGNTRVLTTKILVVWM